MKRLRRLLFLFPNREPQLLCETITHNPPEGREEESGERWLQETGRFHLTKTFMSDTAGALACAHTQTHTHTPKKKESEMIVL